VGVAVLAVAALVILGFFNVLGSRYQNKLDLTSNGQFTLGEQSVIDGGGFRPSRIAI